MMDYQLVAEVLRQAAEHNAAHQALVREYLEVIAGATVEALPDGALKEGLHALVARLGKISGELTQKSMPAPAEGTGDGQ